MAKKIKKNMKKYFLGRLNLSANYNGYDEKKDFISRTLQAKINIEDGIYKYKFDAIESFVYEDSNYFSGFLLKYRSNEEHEIVNDISGKIEKIQVPNEIVGKCRFVFESNTGLISYTVQGSRMTRGSFTEKFTSLFEEVHHGFFVEARIDSIEDRGNFMERVSTMLRIDKIKVVLQPSNPNSDKIWKELDDRLKGENVGKYTEQYDSKKEGPSLIVDDSIEKRIAMSEDGYGITSAIGKNQNNENVVYKTSDNPLNVQGPDHDQPVSAVMQLIYPFMKRVMDRIRRK